MRLMVCTGLVLLFSIAVFCQTDVVKSDARFDPFVPRQVAEKLLLLEDVSAKTTGLSRLASLIWKQDQDYARVLFEKALALTTHKRAAMMHDSAYCNAT